MNVQVFLKCIEAVHNVSPEGFAAIKVTALGLPVILERLSVGIMETQILFSKFDRDNSGKISREDFKGALAEFVPSLKELEVEGLFSRFSLEDQQIDYLEWTNTLRLQDVFKLIQLCKNGPLAETFLSEEETVLVNNLFNRVYRIAEYAAEKKVRLMIDAEQSYFQPAIDHLVLDLQRRFNRKEPIIFHTYQCYLKNSLLRVVTDLERAKREGYWFAAKVVRGAYLVLERARAKEMNYPDPIWSTIEETHSNYHCILSRMMDQIHRSSILVATHNITSIIFVLNEMENRNICRSTGRVYFGQLLGMSDRLTFNLGRNGYKAYKYVPYGPVNEVIPYLLRRAQENSVLLGGAVIERRMIGKALLHRFLPISSHE
eukprot:TRINITY_DN4318_c0_g1_i12.p1 TRINITY_DN4318_c0_g1~~TRINITY_DN4318_c0_g1_i12.p1  ORF type:complete len:373 (+),score=64.67 TRINITY_DN4318_c0_g1_i12:604-1722(+)